MSSAQIPGPTSPLRSAVASGVTWTATSAGLLFFLGFAQTATLAHFLHPRDFGLMAAVAVLLGFGQAFGDMGVSSAVIARQTSSQETLSSLYWLNVLAGLIVFVLVIACTPLVVRFYDQPRLSDLVPWAALIFVIRPFGQQFFVLLERDLKFKTLTKIEVIASVASTTAAIAAAVSGAGVWALIIGTLVKAGVWSALLVIHSWRPDAWRPQLHFRANDVRGYLGFGLYQMGERSVTFLYTNVDYLLIGRFLSIEALGAYSLAYQLILRPVSVFNPIVTRVAFPAFAKRQTNDDALRRGYLEMMKAIGFVVAPAMVALAATAPVLVPVLFGERWHQSIVLIQILALVGLLSALGNPVGSVMLAKNRPDVGFKMNVASLIVMTGALLVAVQSGLTAVAVTEAVVVFAALLAWSVIIRNTLSLRSRELVAPLVSPLLYAAIVGCLMLGVRDFLDAEISSGTAVLLITLLVGALADILLVIGFERPYLRQLRTLFGGRRRTDPSKLGVHGPAVSVAPLDHADYRASKYFPSLDGLRAISILLVVLFHVGSPTFAWANGRLGVAVFFVLSGYLITTLLLRERDDKGAISLRGFYLRRVFRILPLYYVVLLLYVAVYIVGGIGNLSSELRASLPWFLTYMNDFRPGILHGSTPYQQSWSLGVEEKFYLFWPLLGFVLIPRFRVLIALTAAVLPVVLYMTNVAGWFAFYGQVMVGCVLALIMHRAAGYRVVTLAARGPFAIVVALVLLVLERHHPALSLIFPFAVAVVLAGLVSGRTGARALATRPMIWIGQRAYAVYLVHLLCLLVVLHAVRHVVGGGLLPDTIVFLLGLGASLLLADVLRRTVELPMIRAGRSLQRRRRDRAPVIRPAKVG